MTVVHPPPVRILVIFFQDIKGDIWHDHKLLIGRRVGDKIISFLHESLFEHHRQPVGMFGHGKIQTVFKQDIKLQSEQPSLGQHTSFLLEDVAKVLLQAVMADAKGLPEQGPYLCRADIKSIAKLCDGQKVKIAALRA
ncbi:hypothetical protein SDC9_127455 [bioreactor metagenome]|uniref:Uncharacterized protein n=1 Tax=bioreactor metagenome TaxID=1076179 RepID=A0A645CU59_9ZZZZ